jgi:CubicO group peptidase (beta-lactamase class C family)
MRHTVRMPVFRYPAGHVTIGQRNAGLRRTHYTPDSHRQRRLAKMAHGYLVDRVDPSVLHDTTQHNESWLRSAGAMRSTPSDMVRWFRKHPWRTVWVCINDGRQMARFISRRGSSQAMLQ